MKLLICTQVVDRTHSNLALAHRWIEEFAKQYDEVSVICLFEGQHALPANVRVYSLGKEKGSHSTSHYALRFWQRLWQLHGKYDAVFVHMNPEYVLLGGLYWRMTRKRVALWYTHKSVTLKLRCATLLANTVFSASQESFRLQTRKLHIVGHGIDADLFAPRTISTKELRIVTVGRIAKTKRILEMLAALDVLHARAVPFHFSIVGEPLLVHDRAYEQELRKAVSERPYAACVQFLGAVAYQKLPEVLGGERVFINLSETGSVDRAVLEAIAIGLAPVTTNEAFRELLQPYGLYVGSRGAEQLANAIERAWHADVQELQEKVLQEHSVTGLVARMVPFLS